MGHGIVHPTDSMQTEPWSSDLLDFLGSDFAEHGYDLKHTLRLIATSQAYQSRCELLNGEDNGKYHFAGPRAKRMTAEQFVDTLWQLTGGRRRRWMPSFCAVRSIRRWLKTNRSPRNGYGRPMAKRRPSWRETHFS